MKGLKKRSYVVILRGTKNEAGSMILHTLKLINESLSSGVITSVFKSAVIKSLLIKPSLDKNKHSLPLKLPLFF